ncbi:MAG: FAD binding domain-containing protein [Bacteroidia bacterium]|nr:FAD binding domain-containing protein [Bacteroidia bacterium]
MIAENKYMLAGSVDEALQAAKQYAGSYRFLAGGTDVISNKIQGNDTASCLIDISRIRELKEINGTGSWLKIGSLVKLEELKNHELIREEFPALIQAAHSVGSPLIRKTATLGGNLLCENRCVFYNQSEWWREAVGYCLKCNGDICIATGGKKNCFSKFVSDTAPVLIALNAEVEIADETGVKIIPVRQLYTSNGINSLAIPAGSLMKSIQLLPGTGLRCVFMKLRPREAVDFTSLTTAVSVDGNKKIKIVLGGVDPGPVIYEPEAGFDPEEMLEKVMKKPRMVDNDFYPRGYRREMIKVFIRRSLVELKII